MATTTTPPMVNSDAYLAPSAPAEPTPLAEIVEALRTIGPLHGLSDEEYAWLARHGVERIGRHGRSDFSGERTRL